MGGLFLITVGLLLLLANFGVASWAVFGFIWHFWPVLLILIGLRIMTKGWYVASTLVGVFGLFAVCYVVTYSLYITSPATRPGLEQFRPYFPVNQPRWHMQPVRDELNLSQLTNSKYKE